MGIKFHSWEYYVEIYIALAVVAAIICALYFLDRYVVRCYLESQYTLYTVHLRSKIDVRRCQLLAPFERFLVWFFRPRPPLKTQEIDRLLLGLLLGQQRLSKEPDEFNASSSLSASRLFQNLWDYSLAQKNTCTQQLLERVDQTKLPRPWFILGWNCFVVRLVRLKQAGWITYELKDGRTGICQMTDAGRDHFEHCGVENV